MNEDLDYTLKVKADPTGARQAAKEVRAVGRAAQEAAAKTRDGMRLAEAATARLGKAAKAASKAFQLFGIVGLVTQVKALWDTVTGFFDKMREKERQAQEDARKSAETLLDSMSGRKLEEASRLVGAVGESYAAVSRSIDAAAAAQGKLAAAQAEYREAVRAESRQRLELQKLRELAALAPGDEAGRARVAARYENLAAEWEHSDRAADALYGIQGAEKAASAANARKAAADNAVSAQQDAIAILAEQLEAARDRSGAVFTGSVRDTAGREEWKKGGERAAKEAAGLARELAKANRELAKLSEAAAAATVDAEAAGIRLRTARRKYSTETGVGGELAAQKSADNTARAEEAATSARLDRLREGYQAALSYLTSYSGAVRGAASATPAPRREDYDPAGRWSGAWNTAQKRWERRFAPADDADRLARSAQGALDTIKGLNAGQLAEVFDRLNEQLKSLDRAITLMKAREKIHK